MTEPAPRDVWTDTDYPVLLSLAAWDVADDHLPLISLEEIIDALGWSVQDIRRVGRSLDRLDHAGLIEVVSATMGTPYPTLVHRVTTDGLAKSGAWPSEASVLEALQATIADIADHTSNPEEASKFRDVARLIGRVSVSVGTDFASRLVAHAAGLG